MTATPVSVAVPATPPETAGGGVRLSMRWIVAAAAVLLTAGVGLAVSGVAEQNAREALMDEVETRLALQARNLALTSAEALLTDYPELTLAPLVTRMRARQPELAFVAVVDRHGIVQGHENVRRIGAALELPKGLRPVPARGGEDGADSLRANDEIVLAAAPIRHPGGAVIGTALVALRRDYVAEVVERGRGGQQVVFGALVLAGVLASVVLMSFLLRPLADLRAGIERIGRGDWNVLIPVRDRTEMGMLAGAINDMAGRLRSAQADLLERERLAHEMELAQRIQRSLLPSSPLATEEAIVEGSQIPATEVGGDSYDVFRLADGTWGLSIADVSGKGLAGCLVTSMLYALIRALRNQYRSPAELLSALDERLAEALRPGSFVTMFYGVFDPRTGRLVFAGAGHNPLLVYRSRSRRVEWHGTEGIPLGAVRGGAVRASLEDHETYLLPGDIAVQFTDGLSETERPGDHEPFGLDRLGRVLEEQEPSNSAAAVRALHDAVAAWRGDGPREDDETVWALRWNGAVSDRVAPRIGGDRAAPEIWRIAQAAGVCLRLPAIMGSLDRIEAWLRAGALAGADPEEARLVHLAIHEGCSNVIEHGLGEDPDATFELWWVPEPSGPGPGAFLIRDQGPPFRPDLVEDVDLRDPEVRKRGRGFGMTIVRRVMAAVEYYPATDSGNILLLRRNAATAAGREAS